MFDFHQGTSFGDGQLPRWNVVRVCSIDELVRVLCRIGRFIDAQPLVVADAPPFAFSANALATVGAAFLAVARWYADCLAMALVVAGGTLLALSASSVTAVVATLLALALGCTRADPLVTLLTPGTGPAIAAAAVTAAFLRFLAKRRTFAYSIHAFHAWRALPTVTAAAVISTLHTLAGRLATAGLEADFRGPA